MRETTVSRCWKWAEQDWGLGRKAAYEMTLARCSSLTHGTSLVVVDEVVPKPNRGLGELRGGNQDSG